MEPAWVTALPRVYNVYRWKPVRLVKVRGVIRVDTKNEQFALKPILTGGDRLEFLNRVHQYLQQQSYSHLLPWQRTKYGDAFFREKEVAFYALPWFGKEWSREAAISDNDLSRSLAEMHLLTEKTDLIERDPGLASFATIVEQWDAQINRMRSYVETAHNREFAAPFDNVLLANVDELEHAALFAVKGLKHLSEKEEKKPFRRVFCHRRIHPYNLVFEQDNWKWIDYIHAGADVPVHDLALYMQNFPIDNGTDDHCVAMLHARLAAYEANFPLRLREKQLLCLFLAYPRTVFKLLDHYYQHQRTRDEMLFTERLEGTIRYFQVMKRFVRQLWPRGNTNKQKERDRTRRSP